MHNIIFKAVAAQIYIVGTLPTRSKNREQYGGVNKGAVLHENCPDVILAGLEKKAWIQT